MHKWRFMESMVADAPDHKGVFSRTPLERELGLAAAEMPPQEAEAGSRRRSNADSGQAQEG